MNIPSIKLIKISLFLSLIVVLTIACKGKKSKTDNTEGVYITEEKTTIKNDSQLGDLALYTLRDAMGENAKATLKTVSKVGYKNGEAASYKDGKYYDMLPADFKDYLEELNLNPVNTHQSSVTLKNAAC